MANPIDKIGQGFGSEFNEGWLLGPENQSKKLSFDSKSAIAHELLDDLRNLLVGK